MSRRPRRRGRCRSRRPTGHARPEPETWTTHSAGVATVAAGLGGGGGDGSTAPAAERRCRTCRRPASRDSGRRVGRRDRAGRVGRGRRSRRIGSARSRRLLPVRSRPGHRPGPASPDRHRLTTRATSLREWKPHVGGCGIRRAPSRSGGAAGTPRVGRRDRRRCRGAVTVSPKPPGSTPTLLVTVGGGDVAACCEAFAAGVAGLRSRTSLITGTRASVLLRAMRRYRVHERSASYVRRDVMGVAAALVGMRIVGKRSVGIVSACSECTRGGDCIVSARASGATLMKTRLAEPAATNARASEPRRNAIRPNEAGRAPQATAVPETKGLSPLDTPQMSPPRAQVQS